MEQARRPAAPSARCELEERLRRRPCTPSANDAVFDGLVSNLPDHPGDGHHDEDVRVDIDEMLPESHEAYHYSGSLTTPPCSEGVRWLVAVEPVAMSSEQLSAFASRINHNNRPTQAIHERTVSIIEVGKR